MAKDLLHTTKFYKDPLYDKIFEFGVELNGLGYYADRLDYACGPDTNEQMTSDEVKWCILGLAKAMKAVCERFNDLDIKEMIERIPVEKGS